MSILVGVEIKIDTRFCCFMKESRAGRQEQALQTGEPERNFRGTRRWRLRADVSFLPHSLLTTKTFLLTLLDTIVISLILKR